MIMRKLILLAALLCGCGTVHENTTGGYLAPKGSPYYERHQGTLYAWDGQTWYASRVPEHQAGYIGGTDVGTVEQWIVAGGSRTRTYRRTWETFRDQTKRPVFIQN